DAKFVDGSYGGFGLVISDALNIQWWGLTIHDSAATGLLVHSNVGPNTGLDISAELYHNGLDLSRDPDAEEGTSLHAGSLGSDDVGNQGSAGEFALTVHDQPTGAAVSIGNNLHDSELWVDARRITFEAAIQVAGNAIQWWAGQVTDDVVHYLYGEDLAGRM